MTQPGPAAPWPPGSPRRSTAPPERPSTVLVIGTVLAFAAVVVFGLLNWMIGPGNAAYKAGELTGILVAPVLVWLIVFGIARAMGKARTAAGMVHIAFWTTGLLALGQIVTLFNRGVGGQNLLGSAFLTAVTDSERAGLVVDTTGIHHSQFGFSLPSPGPDFQTDSGAQHVMDSVLARETALAAWVLRSQNNGATVIVEVTKGARETERNFRAFVRGVQRNAGKGEGTQVLLDSTTWAGPTREYRFAARSPAGVYVQIRCVPHTTGGVGLIVCVTTGSGDPHDLDFVREGLAFAGP